MVMRGQGTRLLLVAGLAALLAGCASLNGAAETSESLPAGSAHERIAASTPIGLSAAGNYLAAEHAGMERDGTAADTYFARALSAEPDNAAILEHAFLLDVAEGDIMHAADLAHRIVVLDPSSRMARLILSLEDLKAGRYVQAGADIDAASGQDASDVVWVTVRAWAYAGNNESSKALALLSSDQARKSLGAFALYHEALVLDYAGRAPEADRAYATAILASQGQSVRLLEAYGRFLVRTGRAPDAIKLYQAYDTKMPGNPVIEMLLADIKTGHSDKKALISTPAEGAAEALYGIAVVLAGEQAAELPLVYVQLALYQRPGFDIGLSLRGELFEAQENWDGAAKSFAAVSPRSPLSSFAVTSRARDLARLGRFDEATSLMRARVKKAPADIDGVVALGDLYRAQEKWSAAAETYGKALDVAGNDQQWQILYARGVSLERAGDWPQAEALLQKALVLQPTQPQILNYLGYSWIDRGEHLKEALALIGKAVAAKPDDGYIVDSLGWAYYRLGDYANATRFLEHAVELKPDDPTINDHLGDAYWRVGRRLEAHFQWSHALAFKPTDEDARKITKKLADGLDEPADAKPSRS